MKKFLVTGLVAASVCVEVEAEDEEQAVEIAWDSDAFSPSLCHQCSREVDLGDVYETLVEELEDDE